MKNSFHTLRRFPFRRVKLSPYFQLSPDGVRSLDQKRSLVVEDDCLEEFMKILNGEQDSISEELESTFELMAKNGMLTGENSAKSMDGAQEIPWLTVVHDLYHNVRQEIIATYRSDSILYRIMHHEASKAEIHEWLIRCFQYTASAYHHISGVVENQSLMPNETHFWKSFRDDERHHWRIYERVFRHLGLSLDEVRKEPARAEVSAFTEYLRSTGGRSQYEYAALLFMMEIPPVSDDLLGDAQFGPLVRFYDFPVETIEPLWNHCRYNGTSEHDAIWFNILRSRESYSAAEASAILFHAKTHCRLSATWNELGMTA